MQVNRNDFLQALLQIKPGISSKERVDQASSVVFSDGKMLSYNEQIMVMTPFDAGFEGAVRAEELFGILNKLSAEKIDIAVEDGQVIIKAGRSKSGIRFEEAVRLPVTEVLAFYEGLDLHSIPESLLPAFQKAKFCASSNMNNLKLTGVHFKDGKIIATDNYRIIKITVPGKGLKKVPEFLLPASCIDFLAQYSFSEFGVSDSWAFFSGEDGLLFCVRLLSLDEPYPETEHLFNVDGPEIILPAELTTAIDKTSVFTKTIPHENDRMVSITMKPGRVVVRGEGVFGWYEENVKATEYTGEQVKFSANPDFLKDIVPKVQHAKLGEATLLFEGEDFSYVFALCVKEEDA